MPTLKKNIKKSAQQYDNNMRGALFPNGDKEKQTQPDYKGNCEIEGVHYWIAAWEKETTVGDILSLAFTKRD